MAFAVSSELMSLATDPDVARIGSLARDVHHAEHKMHAFVRFREVGRDRNSRFVAWFEPPHYIVEAVAPFFEHRFADMAWSILTPDRCAHWDGSKTIFTEGVSQSEAPSEESLGGSVAQLLRQHLQSRPAQGECHEGRDAGEILAEPSRSVAD